MTLRRTLRNILSNYALVASSGLTSFILTPLLFHYLHPVNYAVLAFALAFAALLETVSLGMATALVGFVSNLIARGLHDELRRLASSAFFILVGLGVLLAALVGLLSPLAASFFRMRSAEETSGSLVIALIGLGLLFQLPSSALRGYLEGCQDFHLANAVDVCGHVLRAIAIIVLLNMGCGLLPIAATFPSIAMLRFFGLTLITNHAAIPFRPRTSDFSWLSLKNIGTFATLCLVEDAATPLFSQSDTFLAARLLSLPELAILTIARRIPWAISRLAQVTIAVAYPMVSSAAAREDQQAVRRFMLASTRNTLALAVPLCTVLYTWAEAILRIWVGPEVLSGLSVFRIFLVFALFAGLQQTPLTLLYGMGKIGFSVVVYLSMLIGVVVFGPIACAKGGLVGLALMYASVQALATILFFARALKVAGVPLAWWAKKTLTPVIVAELAPLAWLRFSVGLLPHSILGVCLSSAAALSVFLIVFALILTGMKPQTWRGRLRVLMAGSD